MTSINFYKDNYNKAVLESLSHKEAIHILYGGSASGKSYGIAQYYLEAVLTLNRNVLALRKIGSTVKNSLFALFCQIINLYGLNNHFKVNKSEFTITSFTGFKIICGGLDDPEKIKSITVEKGTLTDIWLEEATEFTEEDFNQLTLRMRGRSDKIKRIRLSFNPISNLHWIKKRFFDNPSPEVYILKTTYKDNIYLTDQDRTNIERLKDIDQVYYNIYALGEWGALGNLVYNNWEVQDFTEIETQLNSYLYGLDFGFSSHPSALIKVAEKDNRLYIIDEYYEKGKTNPELSDSIKPIVENNYVWCDSAEPKSIKELRQCGIMALPVAKGKDSIKFGIQYIKQKKIIIHPRCRSFLNEIQTYKYKQDKDGNTLNEPVDLNNHLMDALRYALENSMKAYNKSNLSMGDLGI